MWVGTDGLPDPPSAIFCCNNKMTLGLMRAPGELRVPCPERVSVVGFDDFDWAANVAPGLFYGVQTLVQQCLIHETLPLFLDERPQGLDPIERRRGTNKRESA